MSKKKNTNIWDEFFNLKPKEVKLNKIYLDPNNPRLETPENKKIPDNRIDEEKIQKRYMNRMRDEIGINDLTESIITSGFWTIDRVVLREFKRDKYVVVEGNRRITALKILINAQEEGRVSLSENILKGILIFETLIYKGSNPEIAWIIQGFRHTPGTKAWKRYPQSKFLAEFETKTRKTILQIAEIFPGLSRGDVAKLIRSYYGFEQAKNDEDYGDLLSIDQFNHFYEIILHKPQIKDWMGWDDNRRQFTNSENLKKYLSWATAEEGDKRKIDISPTTRDILTKLIKKENKKLFEKFDDGNLSLKQCEEELLKEETKRGVLDISDNIRYLDEMVLFLTTLPVAKLQLAKTKEDKEQKKKLYKKLIDLESILKQQLKNLK